MQMHRAPLAGETMEHATVPAAAESGPPTASPLPPPRLSPGDIVMFRFPSSESRRSLEKRRPCLVLAVDGDEVTLAYGTTRESRVSRARELHLVRVPDIAAAGLARPTRFLAWRTVRVPQDSARFCSDWPGGPLRGRLPDRLHRGLARLRALARPDPAHPAPSRARRRPPHLGGPVRY